MSIHLPNCPKCNSKYVYQQDVLLVCPECAFEWNPEGFTTEASSNINEIVYDSNGNELKHGDTVMVIKNLPVKGSSSSIKAGTKVKNIRLNPNSDHNIDCKITGFGAMALKSEFVKKV